MKCKGVLVVDDDKPIRDVISSLLEIEGYKVELAENGKEALEFLNNCSSPDYPGIILLDIMMPVMGGLDFLEAFHETEKFSTVPVVVMSANSSFRERAVRKYSVEQMKKPLNMDDILSVIRHHCGTIARSREIIPDNYEHRP